MRELLVAALLVGCTNDVELPFIAPVQIAAHADWVHADQTGLYWMTGNELHHINSDALINEGSISSPIVGATSMGEFIVWIEASGTIRWRLHGGVGEIQSLTLETPPIAGPVSGPGVVFMLREDSAGTRLVRLDPRTGYVLESAIGRNWQGLFSNGDALFATTCFAGDCGEPAVARFDYNDVEINPARLELFDSAFDHLVATPAGERRLVVAEHYVDGAGRTPSGRAEIFNRYDLTRTLVDVGPTTFLGATSVDNEAWLHGLDYLVRIRQDNTVERAMGPLAGTMHSDGSSLIFHAPCGGAFECVGAGPEGIGVWRLNVPRLSEEF